MQSALRAFVRRFRASILLRKLAPAVHYCEFLKIGAVSRNCTGIP